MMIGTVCLILKCFSNSWPKRKMISEKRRHLLNRILRILIFSVSNGSGLHTHGLLWITHLWWPHLHIPFPCQCQCLQGQFHCIHPYSHIPFLEIRILQSFITHVQLLFHVWPLIPWLISSPPSMFLLFHSLPVDPMFQANKIWRINLQGSARLRKAKVLMMLPRTLNWRLQDLQQIR